MTDILVINGQLNEFHLEQLKLAFIDEFQIPLVISNGVNDTWFRVESKNELQETMVTNNIRHYYYFLRGMLVAIARLKE